MFSGLNKKKIGEKIEADNNRYRNIKREQVLAFIETNFMVFELFDKYNKGDLGFVELFKFNCNSTVIV